MFTKLFGDFLVFVYHCFDRIVIRGYLTALSRPELVVRATVVEGEDASAVIDNEDRAMGAMHDDPALCLNVFIAYSPTFAR